MADINLIIERFLKEENIIPEKIMLQREPNIGQIFVTQDNEMQIFEIIAQYFRAFPSMEKNVNKAKWYKWEKEKCKEI